MPNDAKLGLVAGVAIVLLIAVLFFRRDAQAETPASSTPPAQGSPTIPGMTRPPADADLPPLPPPPTGSDAPLPGVG